jgi:hypothetical protein
VYLYGVIVVGSTFQEHLLNLQKVFQLFREALLKVNPEKCQLCHEEVRYLGNIASPEGITTDPEKLKAIWIWLTLKNKHEIRSLLGLAHIRDSLFLVSRILQKH